MSEPIATDDGANMVLRKVLLKCIVAGVVGVIGALFVLHEDSSAHADIFIDRPPTDVWKVVLNSAAYLAGRLTKDVIESTRQNFEAMNTALRMRVELASR
ncbi:hypothetical protein [Paraburkholderia sp. SIMBA_030]|uniref:hypothetical protein n=1 Tax=Paraburkholderia sp. SIMBA_030 TaxID=3085773 RepID=UPI00397D310D